jgi:DNA replication protein DnaC
MTTTTPPISSDLMGRAQRLGLYGLCAHFGELGQQPWVRVLLDIEEAERHKRSLQRRIQSAHLGRFRPMSDFDWTWPNKIDRAQVEDLFTFAFLKEADNVLLLGPNGVAKTMIAQNLAYEALLLGYTVLFTTASALLSDLGACDTPWARNQRLRKYVRPQLLVLDEVGYLSYDNGHADLLFEVSTRRYERGASTIVTTNKPFSQWNEVFPNAACVVTLIDRLTHRAELVQIEADSYRLKEAKQRAVDKAKRRRTPRNTKDPSPPSPVA